MLELGGCFTGFIVFGLIGWAIGHAKGQPGAGFLAGALLGPLGWLIMLLISDARATCDECGGFIADGARRCKNCGVVLARVDDRPVRKAPPLSKATKIAIAVFLLVLLAFFVAIVVVAASNMTSR